MYSIDWTTGSGRLEFLTFGLLEEHLGMVSYDVEIAESLRLLFTTDNQGELALPAYQPAAGRLRSHAAVCRARVLVEAWQKPRTAACASMSP